MTGERRPPKQPASVVARVAALEAQLAAIQAKAEAAAASAQETHDMVKSLSEALLKPQPGHDKALLDRIAAVTIQVERGEWSLRTLVWLASAAAAVGAAVAALRVWGGEP